MKVDEEFLACPVSSGLLALGESEFGMEDPEGWEITFAERVG